MLGLVEKYYLTVLGSFEKGTMQFDDYPTKEEIIDAIKKANGESARVEKRFVLGESSEI